MLPSELAARATRRDLVELLAYYKIQEQDRAEREWRAEVDRIHQQRRAGRS